MGRDKDDNKMTVWNIISSAAAGLLGAMGFGGGGVLILYLTMVLGVKQISAQGINLIFFIPSAIIGLIIHIKHNLIKFKQILPILISAIPGVALGLYLTTVISNEMLSKIFGGILVIMGLKELLTRNKNRYDKNSHN